MLYKKYVSMMVVMALLLCLTMPAKVNAESRQPCGPDAWYELSEDGTLVISGTGEITKKFGEDSAVQHKIKKIIMEEGIEKIGERAFAFCNAKEVDLPQTLKKIGEQAFYYTLIKTVNIPPSVSEYGKDIFMHSDVETAYLVHTADTKEQLDADTDTLLTIARKHLCQFATLKYQQMDGLNTALPIGHRKINAVRTLTTESLAVLMPFRVQEIMDSGGIYCGENAISRNLIMCNKEKLMNPNSFLLGVPGIGKSFSAKMLIVFLALATGDDILICDPEREYASLIEAMGGEVIRIAAGSPDHINAMDMVEGYGDEGSPIIDKSEFVLSLFEQLDRNGIGPAQRSLIDRCTEDIYEDYQNGGKVPTLCALREKLLEQDEREAKSLALALELFTDGSLDAFAHETNVDVNNRMVVYDIMDLGKQLKTMGLLVITDAMLNRVTENWKKGKRTHIFLDEFHVVFENEHSGTFFNSAWRRFRKRNAFPTAITQNVEYLLDSVLASTMLSNSEYIVMLNQAASDRQKLAELLNISNEQMSYITNADAGCGLIKYGSSLVPFVNKFPKDTRLYKLMTTKPGEDYANRSRM